MSLPDPHDEIGAAIRATAAGVRAPQHLRDSLGAGRGRTRAPRTRLAAAAAAVAVIAVLLLLTGSGGPSVSDVAAAALNPPTSPAPRPDDRRPGSLDARVGGLAFPDYEPRWGWKAVGIRSDEVDGRRAVTVIYRRGSRGVHYTIVDGAPLAPPDDARRLERAGVAYAASRQGAARVLSWELEGRTCVLASDTLGITELLRVAAWD